MLIQIGCSEIRAEKSPDAAPPENEYVPEKGICDEKTAQLRSQKPCILKSSFHVSDCISAFPLKLPYGQEIKGYCKQNRGGGEFGIQCQE
jgi:hypothetical protein